MERQAGLGSAELSTCTEHTPESVLRRHLCLWSLSATFGNQRGGRGPQARADRRSARLESLLAQASRRIHYLGRVHEERGTLREKPSSSRNDSVERSAARRIGLTARTAVVRKVWPGAARLLP